MNTPTIADYTTRKSYQQNYAKENREAINARKREWRAARKKALAFDLIAVVEPDRAAQAIEIARKAIRKPRLSHSK